MNCLWEVPPLQVTHLREVVSELGVRRIYMSIPAGAGNPFYPAEAIDAFDTAGLNIKNACTIALLRFRKKRASR